MGLIALAIVLAIAVLIVAAGWRRVPVRTRGETGTVEPPDA